MSNLSFEYGPFTWSFDDLIVELNNTNESLIFIVAKPRAEEYEAMFWLTGDRSPKTPTQ